MSSSLDKNIVIDAFKKAQARRKIDKNLTFHSDQGSQYSSNQFSNYLKRNFTNQSMSKKNDCWDNTPAESFFFAIKSELINNRIFAYKSQALSHIFEDIEIFYNN